MLKTIETLAQGKILTAKEQQKILGGTIGTRCDNGDCGNPDLCCSQGYCLSIHPDKNGHVPACE